MSTAFNSDHTIGRADKQQGTTRDRETERQREHALFGLGAFANLLWRWFGWRWRRRFGQLRIFLHL
jgi:hypothetical protein